MLEISMVMWNECNLPSMLHDHVNKCGECEFQLISNLFDVIRIRVIQI